jgi:hypothetical protein
MVNTRVVKEVFVNVPSSHHSELYRMIILIEKLGLSEKDVHLVTFSDHSVNKEFVSKYKEARLGK